MKRLVMGSCLSVLLTASAVGAQPVREVDRGWALMGGLATGDGSWDAGLAVAAPYRIPLGGRTFALRAEPWLSRYGGPGDSSLLLLGVGVMPRYLFTDERARLAPYVFGGPGLYYRNFSLPGSTPSAPDENSSDARLGITVGGGIQFGPRLIGEVRIMDVDGFLTVPLLIGIRF